MFLKIRNFSSCHATHWNDFTFVFLFSSVVPDLPVPTGIGMKGSEKLEGSRTTQAGLHLFGSINRILPSPLFEKPRKREAAKVWYCK